MVTRISSGFRHLPICGNLAMRNQADRAANCCLHLLGFRVRTDGREIFVVDGFRFIVLESPMPGPLAGIRIIDLTTIVMGPYATQILGDMGVDVIKVECPSGDIFRDVSRFRHRSMGAAFLNVNRNKRSLVLNLESDHDKQILQKLLATADVFVYTLRPCSLAKFGLDYNSLCERNPRLIHCGAYGFSEEGPYRGRPAYDDVIQAMSGTASLEGRNNPEGPKFVNTIMADKIRGPFGSLRDYRRTVRTRTIRVGSGD